MQTMSKLNFTFIFLFSCSSYGWVGPAQDFLRHIDKFDGVPRTYEEIFLTEYLKHRATIADCLTFISVLWLLHWSCVGMVPTFSDCSNDNFRSQFDTSRIHMVHIWMQQQLYNLYYQDLSRYNASLWAADSLRWLYSFRCARRCCCATAPPGPD